MDPHLARDQRPPVVIDDIKLVQLVSIGFDADLARTALTETLNDLDAAMNYILEQQKSGAVKTKTTTTASIKPDMTKPGSVLSRAGTNLFVGLAAYVRSRIANYMQYCMICHKKHKCTSETPVICCNPLCIFRYVDIFPQTKKDKMEDEVARVTICPFTDCERDAVMDATEAFDSLLSVNSSVGANQQQLLALQAHRYLPNKQVLDFIESGVKAQGMRIDKIENVLKPELVAAYEAAWRDLHQKRGKKIAAPAMAYHGTATANIESIITRGLLVPGIGNYFDFI
eukprot:TRINITY_DN3147_c0_g3_i1.p1 TRINITY_DN3147_c0_g3~~TRINITY_DN3147_c0_g3_i1.p1  ORF type:complete len:315 (-),score=48.26 TRINITY_DN3147_c0_g3_i1:331-1182(-)